MESSRQSREVSYWITKFALEAGLPFELESRTATSFDALGRPKRWDYDVSNPDTDYMEVIRDCCTISQERFRDGRNIVYDVDPLERRVGTTALRNGTFVKTLTEINGLTTKTYLVSLRISAGGQGGSVTPSKVFQRSETRNLVGDVVQVKTAAYLEDGQTGAPLTDQEATTTYVYDWVNRKVTALKPEGGTIITERYLDGSTYKMYGTAVNGYQRVITYTPFEKTQTRTALLADGTTTPEVSFRVSDGLGRVATASVADDDSDGTSDASAQTTTYTYDTGTGQLVGMTDPDGVVILYGYNDRGQRTTNAIDLNGSGVIDAGDRIQVSNTTFVTTWPDSSTGYTGSYETVSSLNGVTLTNFHRTYDGLMSKSKQAGVSNPSLSVSDQMVDRVDSVWTTMTTNPDGTQRVRNYSNYALVSQVIKDSAGVAVTSTSYGYDPDFGYLITTTDARIGATTIGIDVGTGLRTSLTDPGSRVTKYFYDREGRLVTTLLPVVATQAVNRITTEFTSKGQVEKQWGAQTYPRSYTYDHQGRMKTLTTYSAVVDASTFPAGAGALTSWNYYPVTGLLSNKRDADSKGADYSYTPGGRLKTRWWARDLDGGSDPAKDRLTTTYSYDFEDISDGRQGGELVAVDYNDSTPDLVYTYTSASQLDTVSRGGVPHADYGYDSLYRITSEELNKDTLMGQLTRSYDGLGRAQSVALGNTHAIGYGYDDAGRLDKVWDNPSLISGAPQGTADFIYEYLPNSFGLLHTVTGPVHTVTNSYESTRNVLDVKSNVLNAGSTVISSYDYHVNDLGQREDVAQSGSAFTGTPSIDWGYDAFGQLASADHSTTATRDQAFSYDSIGNRNEAVHGSLTLSGTANYTTDSVNQYQSTPYSTAPSYDEDGNMTAGPVPGEIGANGTELNEGDFETATDIVWDAENRLISITVDGDTLSYDYDYLGRRIIRTRSSDNLKLHYHYDGWNLLSQNNVSGTGALTLARTYTWGLDLSGSIQGAGGVGGLLAVGFKNGGSLQDDYYPCYDGNGNVCQYLDSSGNTDARYEYDSFGRTVSNLGQPAKQWFRFRFSTKHRDHDTGLYYYGYRYYDPVTGRWPSRDPIGERGGVNLYGFVYNNALSLIDVKGKHPFNFDDLIVHETCGPGWCPPEPEPEPEPDWVPHECVFHCDDLKYSTSLGNCVYGNCELNQGFPEICNQFAPTEGVEEAFDDGCCPEWAEVRVPIEVHPDDWGPFLESIGFEEPNFDDFDWDNAEGGEPISGWEGWNE